MGVFKRGLLHIHLGTCGLFGLTISSYITTGSIVHAFPIIQSVISDICMYSIFMTA